MKRLSILVVLTLSIFLLSACNNSNERTRIVVGILQLEQPNEAELIAYDAAMQRFASALSEATGFPVELYEAGDYAIGVTAIAEGNVDILFLSPFTYYNATQQVDVEPLITTSGDFSARPYNTIFLVKSHRDDIQTLEDLRGKSFAFVDPASASGFLYPSYYLVTELGLDRNRYTEAGYFFSSVVFSGSHVNSLVGLLNDNFEATAVAHGLLDFIPIVAPQFSLDDVKVIAETEVIPNPFYIVRRDMDEELKTTIRNFYLNWADEDYFEQVYNNANLRYILPNIDEINTILNLVEVLGVEAD